MRRQTLHTRYVDALGRVVIPKRVREILDIKQGDELDVFYDREDESVTFKKIKGEDSNENN